MTDVQASRSLIRWYWSHTRGLLVKFRSRQRSVYFAIDISLANDKIVTNSLLTNSFCQSDPRLQGFHLVEHKWPGPIGRGYLGKEFSQKSKLSNHERGVQGSFMWNVNHVRDPRAYLRNSADYNAVWFTIVITYLWGCHHVWLVSHAPHTGWGIPSTCQCWIPINTETSAWKKLYRPARVYPAVDVSVNKKLRKSLSSDTAMTLKVIKK